MKISIDPQVRKEKLGDLFGIFFEDLNHAADGGLYAEMVQNRAFEFAPIDNASYHHLTAWEKIENGGTVNLVVETGNPVSNQNPHYLGMDIIFPGEDVGVWNLGYNEGFAFEAGKDYYFSCYAKREQNLEDALHISFRSKEGKVYSEQEILITDTWRRYELVMTASVTDYSGRLAITAEGRGKIYLDFVSLFPKDTYKGRRNGMRQDIAQMLEALHPKFMRFPGGCLVHDGSLDADARDSQYRWKNTLGPIEERPARRSNWGYNQTLGIGYYEYFQFCEDIGAKPIPVLPAGYNPHYHRAAPLDKLQPWIDDALHLIEFANGSPDTVWGGKRAELGHPEPFGLEYIGIGNEEVGAEFFERYEIICRAVKEKYPRIKVIGTSGPFAGGGEFDRGWKSAGETDTDLVDEHYYMAPEWFLASHHRYDSYDRSGPKVFLGEYASWGNTWYNALAESSYMLGLERNAGAVALACYAPMLCNADYINWQPDMIWFNNHQVYGTANYYVQKLFMEHQGDWLLEAKVEGMPQKETIARDENHLRGEIRIKGNDSTVEYTEISLVNEDTGEVKTFEDTVTGRGETGKLGVPDCTNYTLRVKARELEGFKGFQILFGHHSEEDHLCWTIGGWQNQDTIVGERIHGRNSDLCQYQFEVEKDREYQLELQVRGRDIRTWIDGTCIHDIECKKAVIEPLYYSASADDRTGEIILKTANVKEEAQTVEVCLEGIENMVNCQIWQMGGWEKEAKNSFLEPELVVPRQYAQKVRGDSFSITFPGESFTVIRMSEENN